MDADEAVGGRVFFSSVGRSLEVEDEIVLTSVGVDIGSATSHLAVSRLVLERADTRYVVAERTLLYESAVILTPFAADGLIDAERLGAFIAAAYAAAGITPAQIDTGALILTGVAVRRRNARNIAELFADAAGRFVSVSAGDSLETILAAHGSGAAALSAREGVAVLNVDIGGGTAKIARCEGGEVVALTAIDVGARLVALDAAGRVARIEEAGAGFAAEAGVALALGGALAAADAERIAAAMADRLAEAMRGGPPSPETEALLRLEPLPEAPPPAVVTFSGGVSEYVYGREAESFGDLGEPLARAVLARTRALGVRLERPAVGIRATVIGASQYTVQVSGSTIFVAPDGTLPLRNIPVLRPAFPLGDAVVDPDAVAAAAAAALARLDLAAGDRPVAVCYRFEGSAGFHRLDAFCRGLAAGLAPVLAHGHPVVLVGDGDIGGLVGLHFFEELRLPVPVVSIDGIVLEEFDFIDIGAILPNSGAVPVVIKSLVFPATAALGRADPALARRIPRG